MSEQKTITGKLNKFLYQTSSGWAIALFKTTNGSGQVKIKGQISLLEPKVVYELFGSFQEHPKYGKNFDVTSFKLLDLTTNDQYLTFFKDMIAGIGEVTGKKILDQYLEEPDLFAAILKNPEKLDQVKGLKPVSKRLLLKEVNNLVNENKLTTIFFNQQLKMDFLTKMKNNFVNFEKRDELIEKTLSTDFYHYAKRNNFTPFDEVDKIAMFFQKLEPTDEVRLAWNLNHLIEEILNQNGNTYTSRTVLLKRFHDQLGIFDDVLFDQALNKAIELKLIFQQSNAYFSDESWNDELTIANEILARIEPTSHHLSQVELKQLIQEIENEIGNEMKIKDFHYDAQQLKVFDAFIKASFLLVNGGPGTGKTTVLKGMVKLFKKLNGSDSYVAIAAPTGRAASRINELDPSLHAKTIHKLLQATEDGHFEINAMNPLEADLIIIDESSMIDNKLFASLLDSSHQASKIVFIGDENQLPSVGYGEVFSNLLSIEEISQVKLNQIHRQKEGNGIIDLAYKVLNNEVNNLNDLNLKNVNLLFNQVEPMKVIQDIFETSLTTSNVNDVQVITSFYKGDLGINLVNQTLQEVYQTKKLAKNLAEQTSHCLICQDTKFYPDDKVMYLVNDTALGLSNGDVGSIQTLKTTNNKLNKSVVVFNEEVKNFTSDNFNNLTLSYGCSVHKTQGSEYDQVIFVLEKGVNEFFLNKKLIYTAITRAKKELYLVGDSQLFLKAIQREAKPRKTGLVGRMKSMLKKEYNF